MIQNLLNRLKEEDNLKYIFKNGGISFLFKILGIVFGFFVIWLISKTFNEEYYGAFALMQVILQLLVLVFTMGLHNMLVIEISKKIDDKLFHYSFLIKIIKWVFLLGILPSIILYFFSAYISNTIFLKPNLEGSFKIIGLSLVFFLLHEITLYYFIARKEFAKFGFFMFVLPNVLFILLISFFHSTEKGETQLFYFYAAAFIISLIIELIIIFSENLKKIEIEVSSRQIMRQSIPMMLSGVTFFLNSSVSVIILGRLVTQDQIGIFNAAFKWGSSTQLIMLTINIIIAPKVADLYNQKKFLELKKFIHSSTKLIGLVSIPIAIVLIMYSKLFLGFLGSEYVQGSTVLIIITLSTFINSISGNVDQILNMTQNQKWFFVIIFMALIANVIANLLLIPKYGIIGAAYASLLSILVMNVFSLIIIKKKLGYYTLW